jgi:outer membrane PBP1 activator LpoA protein
MLGAVKNLIGPVVLALFLAACGSSIPPPSDRLASAEAAARSARELGAEKEPKAALHLKLATEQIDQAKGLMHNGDNRRADLVLQRASADAELSVMLAKEHNAKGEAAAAQEKVKTLKGGR